MYDSERTQIFKIFGASILQAEELLNYSRSRLTDQFTPNLSEDEPFAEVWAIYCEESITNGAYNTLRKYLPQLDIPNLLTCPDEMTLSLYKSEAGKIPIIFTTCRDDFIALVRALAYKNEPFTVPDSMGACMVKGFSNRARIIILSNIGYSGIKADELELSENKWRDLSFIIRREHECTHYLTQRVFGSARNNMFDELIADYAGIVKALGRFDANLFFKFTGLENYPEYRQGGRMDNYKGNPPLTDGAFIILQKLVHQSALNLEKQKEHPADAKTLIELYKLSLEELAIKN